MMELIHTIIGATILGIQLTSSISIAILSKKSVGTVAKVSIYMFLSLILFTLGTATYMFGDLFFDQKQITYIGSFYMISGLILNMIKFLVLDPNAKESKIKPITANVQEFFGD